MVAGKTVLASMKPGALRRVWRMTSDSPLGEYLELVTKDASPSATEWPGEHAGAAPPETREAPRSTSQPGATVESKSVCETPRASTPIAQHSPSNAREASPLKLRVLRPAQVESWQSSSFDLLSGLQVRDVTDTIPGCVFDELFKDRRTED